MTELGKENWSVKADTGCRRHSTVCVIWLKLCVNAGVSCWLVVVKEEVTLKFIR